jgi:hypothetical protein
MSIYHCGSCHPDETPQGHMFTSLFPKEESTMLAAFQEYAEVLFPEFLTCLTLYSLTMLS